MYDEFSDLLLDDGAWWERLAAGLRLLADNDPEQPALFPVDDLLGVKKYKPCPRRGTHLRLVECWLCWADVTWGYASASEVLAADDLGGGA